ncbi:MAG: HypC/HybG/HupF family hydrogenase formation chaperone [Candidatus Komeilibacteria bacterium]|nr:HypC/HybG/HupF family hydrogenase formation chaperone [Candidatus Komeilibacteria bacterium]
MCFTIPRKIVTIDGTKAVVDDGHTVDIEGLPECGVGDYIFVTSGIAVARLTPEEGVSMRSLIKETHETIQNRR